MTTVFQIFALIGAFLFGVNLTLLIQQAHKSHVLKEASRKWDELIAAMQGRLEEEPDPNQDGQTILRY